MEDILELRDEAARERVRARAREILKSEFCTAITGDLDAPCLIGPKWVTGRGRLPNVGDLLMDALDNKDFMERAVRILVTAAGPQAASTQAQRDAAKLLEDVARNWADQRADDYVR